MKTPPYGSVKRCDGCEAVVSASEIEMYDDKALCGACASRFDAVLREVAAKIAEAVEAAGIEPSDDDEDDGGADSYGVNWTPRW